MSTITSLRRAGTALVGSALAASLVAGVAPAQAVSSTSPAGRGAGWLAKQLNAQGLVHNRQFGFDDYGLTVDTAVALQTIGGHRTDVVRVRKAMAKHVDDYTTFDNGTFTDVAAGAVAKLLVFAQTTGAHPRSFGGVNLVHRLSQRVATAAPNQGRIEDRFDATNPQDGDFANVVGQIFAVRGLLKAGDPKGASALSFLLEQQCGPGFFRLSFNPNKSSASQGCRVKRDDPDTDVTALAVIELAAVAKGHATLQTALGDATVWLKRHQNASGSFGGSGPTSAPNANSTGLAGWAFLTEGLCGPARGAAGWLSDRQLKGNFSGTPLDGERGAIGYDNPTLKAAKQDGIVKETRDKWRRATAQAAPALLALSGCTP